MKKSNQDEHDRHEQRVQKIITRAHREVGVRDLLVFSFARMWTVLLAIGASMYALVGGWHPDGKDRQNDKDQETDKMKGNP